TEDDSPHGAREEAQRDRQRFGQVEQARDDGRERHGQDERLDRVAHGASEAGRCFKQIVLRAAIRDLSGFSPCPPRGVRAPLGAQPCGLDARLLAPLLQELVQEPQLRVAVALLLPPPPLPHSRVLAGALPYPLPYDLHYHPPAPT